tara:strand:+ start:3926 stop:4672 length:747 start_codon:yes stop_codon:yes gene_type:complete
MKIEIIPTQPAFETLLELYPPQNANKFLPEWYKKMKLGNKADTMMNEKMSWEGTKGAKDCPAIQDYFTTGIVIPLWGDFLFKTYKTNEGLTEQHWDFSTAHALNYPLENFVDYHNQMQIGEMDIETTMYAQILKFQLPYKIIVPEGYSILYQDPFYHFRKEIKCLSGVVEADKWGFVAFPFSLEQSDFYLEAGTPLVHCFVYKRESEKIDLITRSGTDEEYEHIRKQVQLQTISRNNYKENKFGIRTD